MVSKDQNRFNFLFLSQSSTEILAIFLFFFWKLGKEKVRVEQFWFPHFLFFINFLLGLNVIFFTNSNFFINPQTKPYDRMLLSQERQRHRESTRGSKAYSWDIYTFFKALQCQQLKLHVHPKGVYVKETPSATCNFQNNFETFQTIIQFNSILSFFNAFLFFSFLF